MTKDDVQRVKIDPASFYADAQAMDRDSSAAEEGTKKKKLYEHDAQLAAVLAQVARHRGISPASMLDLLLRYALDQWAEEKIDEKEEIEKYLQISRSPRYQAISVIDGDDVARKVNRRIQRESLG